MAKTVQLKRGTTAQTNAYVGAIGEITVDTDKDLPVVHDGSQAGGFAVAAKALANGSIQLINRAGVIFATISTAGGTLDQATENVRGTAEIATSAEAQALASDAVVLSALKLAEAFKGANQSLAASGYQKLPGGLIIQWGSTGAIAGGGSQAITFPVAFNNLYTINVSKLAPNTINDCINILNTPTNTGFTAVNGGSATNKAYWVAIGI